jgi:hypothetical protein
MRFLYWIKSLFCKHDDLHDGWEVNNGVEREYKVCGKCYKEIQ